MRFNGIGLTILFVSVLSACGGGGGDTPVTTQPLETTTGMATVGTTGTGTTDTGITGTTGTGTTDTGITGTTGTGTTDTGLTGTTGTGTTDTGITGTTGTGTTDTGLTGTTGTGTADSGTTGGTNTTPAVYETPFGVAQCSVDDIKGRVDFDMRDYYIYYDQVPTVNLANYDSGDALIKDLRVEPDTFSAVRDASTQAALFEEGVNNGFGFWIDRSADNVIRFQRIEIGSPANVAGILRGDELIELNGRPVTELTGDDYREILGPDNIAPVGITLRTGNDAPRVVSIVQQDFRWTTVAALERFTSDSDVVLPVVGYFSIHSFLAPTQDEIDAVLQSLENAGGFDELIVDLRYNGGGRTSVARYLASVVGGAAVEGKIAFENRFNNKYAEFNRTESFDTVNKPLNMPRVFVLTTDSTASSSEIFINSLKPYIDVVVIGTSTFGKPFTSAPQDYCDKSINAMLSLRVNSAGVSVAGGIPADCRIDDAWNTSAFSTEDPLVAGALQYVIDGTCASDILADSSQLKRKAADGPIFRPKDLSGFAFGD